MHSWFFYALILLGVVATACKPTGLKEKPEQEKIYMREHENSWPDNTEVFFVLSTQEILPQQKQVPTSFYVSGIIRNGEFVNKSQVLGIGELATDGRYGWLELQSKEFNPMESSKKAQTPFVKGYLTKKGFVPSSREVFSEP